MMTWLIPGSDNAMPIEKKVMTVIYIPVSSGVKYLERKAKNTTFTTLLTMSDAKRNDEFLMI